MSVTFEMVSVLSRVFFPLFQDDISSVGEKVPREGTLLIAASHPSSLDPHSILQDMSRTDIRFFAASILHESFPLNLVDQPWLTTILGKKLHEKLVAHATTHQDEYRLKLFEALNMVPLHREQDIKNPELLPKIVRTEATKNATKGSAFSRESLKRIRAEIDRALEQESCIGIFPEGKVRHAWGINPLHQGVAQIALGLIEGYERKVEVLKKQGVKSLPAEPMFQVHLIFPGAINSTFRNSRTIARSKAIPLVSWYRESGLSKKAFKEELVRYVQEQFEELGAIELEDKDTRLVELLSKFYQAEIPDHISRVQSIGTSVQALGEEDADQREKLVNLLEQYSRNARQLKLELGRDTHSSLQWRSAIRAPISLLGHFLHWIPIRRLTKTWIDVQEGPDKRSDSLFLASLAAILAWYGGLTMTLLLIIVLGILPWYWLPAGLLTSALTGIVAAKNLRKDRYTLLDLAARLPKQILPLRRFRNYQALGREISTLAQKLLQKKQTTVG